MGRRVSRRRWAPRARPQRRDVAPVALQEQGLHRSLPASHQQLGLAGWDSRGQHVRYGALALLAASPRPTARRRRATSPAAVSGLTLLMRR